jgi:hypothetical protein
VKRGGKLLIGGLSDKMTRLQQSGERILEEFRVLQRRVS